VHNITIIFSKHIEHGKCNTNELYKIIEQIRPEVIFEEIFPSRYDAYYKEHSISTLETNAVNKYMQEHIIKNIPVDKNIDMKEIKEQYDKFNCLDNIFFDNSEYCSLLEKNLEMVCIHGFKYLNSARHLEISKKLHRLEKIILENINDVELFNRYKMWINNINERENCMIKNIYNYSKENNFNSALFMIGAEHKISIIKKITDMKDDKVKINWIYNIYQEEL
jgi:hypothetical protein